MVGHTLEHPGTTSVSRGDIPVAYMEYGLLPCVQASPAMPLFGYVVFRFAVLSLLVPGLGWWSGSPTRVLASLLLLLALALSRGSWFALGDVLKTPFAPDPEVWRNTPEDAQTAIAVYHRGYCDGCFCCIAPAN